MSTPDRFSVSLAAFCNELRLTFPELKTQIDRAATLTGPQFWSMWKGSLPILVKMDDKALFEERKGLLIGAVQLTPAMWAELSEASQDAIWKYMRTMLLEVAMTMNLDSLDTTIMEHISGILAQERLTSGGEGASAETAEMFEQLKPMMEKLKGMMGGLFDLSGFMDTSGALPDMSSFPEIPEKLRKGRIAKLAEELAKQIDPTDFGLDAAAFTSDNMEEMIKRITELYQKDPTRIMAGVKRVAEKIKGKIMGGSLNREELLAEAQEFVALFKEHPLFKEAIAKFQTMMGAGGLAEMFSAAGGGAGGGAPSERRRAVQERLRKKLAARSQKK